MIDTAICVQMVETLKHTLGNGLIATDIWDREVGLALHGHNTQPAAVALFTELVNQLEQTLAGSNFPKLNRYFILDLTGNHTVVLLKLGGNMLQGMLIDSTKVNMGIVLSVAVPTMLKMSPVRGA